MHHNGGKRNTHVRTPILEGFLCRPEQSFLDRSGEVSVDGHHGVHAYVRDERGKAASKHIHTLDIHEEIAKADVDDKADHLRNHGN